MDLSFSSSHFGGTMENDEFPLPTFPVVSPSMSSSPESVAVNNSSSLSSSSEQFVCEVCSKRCVSRENLRNHKRHVHPKKCYACSVCQKVFKSTSSLRRHASIHMAERPYACSFCGRNYSCLFSCRVHERSHATENTNNKEVTSHFLHSCGQCTKSFKSQSALMAHRNRTHREEVPLLSLPVFPDYEMPVDLSTTSGQSVVVVAASSSSSPSLSLPTSAITNPDGTVSCGACGKPFQTRSLLSYHRRNVHPSVLHACHECGKAFKSKSHLRRHGRVHSGERPFPCGVCPRRYSDARHVREHHAKFHGISSDLLVRKGNAKGSTSMQPKQLDFVEVNPSGGEQVFFGGYFTAADPTSSSFEISKFACSICRKYGTKNLAALYRHIIRRHVQLRHHNRSSNVLVPSCHCPRCGIFSYRPPATLGWHLRTHHSNHKRNN